MTPSSTMAAARTLRAGGNTVAVKLIGSGKEQKPGAPLSETPPFLRLGVIDWQAAGCRSDALAVAWRAGGGRGSRWVCQVDAVLARCNSTTRVGLISPPVACFSRIRP